MKIIPYVDYQEAEVLALYRRVGWTNYTDKPEMLKKAFSSSLLVLSAMEGKRLIGLVRCVGDGASILYIQDLIVHPEYQRKGLGKELVQSALAHFPNVYQTVLLTDDTPKASAFYRSCDFEKAVDLGLQSWVRIQR